MNKFDEMMKEAATQMGILCECPIKNTEDGMHEALAYVLHDGSCNDKAEAVMIAARWMWAHCEKRYHSASAAPATAVAAK